MEPTPRTPVTRSPLTFDDLTAHLLWPRLIGIGSLALSPGRIGLGMILLLLILLVNRVTAQIPDSPGGGPVGEALGRLLHAGESLVWAVAMLRPREAAWSGFELFVSTPWQMLRHHPFSTLAAVALCLPLVCVFGTAITRSAACHYSLNVRLSWSEALAFGVRRGRSALGAILLPLILIGGVSAGLSLAGWAVYGVPGLNLVGALLAPLALLAAVAAALTMAVFVLGHTLLIPAVAAESADAYDAVQRAYAYVVTRPLRMALYLLVALVSGVVAFTLFAGVALLTLVLLERGTGVPIRTVPLAVMAERAGGLFARPSAPDSATTTDRAEPQRLEYSPGAGTAATSAALDATRLLGPASGPASGGLGGSGPGTGTPAAGDTGRAPKPPYPERGWTFSATAWVMNLLGALVALIAGGFGVSVYFVAGVIIYLLMRQLCDGQDQHELWVPGMVEGTMAPGAAARQGPEPPSEPPR